ncbi:MAG: family 20 glycosylhydrolase, partial [Candidatus Lokiarchaeota archaeon]|nr:family 20 glycosylhydrolase [Candidatus Lokiarchaeota archaeon]
MNFRNKKKLDNLIPYPVHCILKSDSFTIKEDTLIHYHDEVKDSAAFLQELIEKPSGFKLKLNSIQTLEEEDNENIISLEIDKNNSEVPAEGYILEISQERIKLVGKDKPGVFYGIQTIRQLLPIGIESSIEIKDRDWYIPCVQITDYPRFPWRGFMLDEVRHFFGQKFVKRIIDLMGLFKLNRLHWHLSDDEGWRIDSKKYPKLSAVGSRRILSKEYRETPNLEDIQFYGGYYCQEELREIIDFAKKNYIEIIPEIEMPGHATASLVAYPEFSCEKPPKIVPKVRARNRHSFCPGKKGTFDFLYGVLKETMDIFQSQWIHIGGDELPKHRWENCSDCASYRKKNNIADLDEMQVEFASNIIRFLNKNKKKVIGWFDFSTDKLLDRNIDKNEVIFQFWHGSEDKVVDFIRKGGYAIISNHSYTYMNYAYYKLPIKKAYNFDPIPNQLESKYHPQILGIESPVWTEDIPDFQSLDFHVFPRLCAYAETAWTPAEEKDYDDFIKRLKCILERLDILKVYYAPLFEAQNSIKARFIHKKLRKSCQSYL